MEAVPTKLTLRIDPPTTELLPQSCIKTKTDSPPKPLPAAGQQQLAGNFPRPNPRDIPSSSRDHVGPARLGPARLGPPSPRNRDARVEQHFEPFAPRDRSAARSSATVAVSSARGGGSRASAAAAAASTRGVTRFRGMSGHAPGSHSCCLCCLLCPTEIPCTSTCPTQFIELLP